MGRAISPEYVCQDVLNAVAGESSRVARVYYTTNSHHLTPAIQVYSRQLQGKPISQPLQHQSRSHTIVKQIFSRHLYRTWAAL